MYTSEINAAYPTADLMLFQGNGSHEQFMISSCIMRNTSIKLVFYALISDFIESPPIFFLLTRFSNEEYLTYHTCEF
jgi:hypothetical protein